MYYYLKGKLVHNEPYCAVIDCGGVGYKLTVSNITTGKLVEKVGEEVILFTHLAVREDDMELFGFITYEERACFHKLITVSGVGPKAAINILSTMAPDELISAIYSENTKAIAKAQGIGSKTAARIILELKDKIQNDAELSNLNTAVTPTLKPKLSAAANKNLTDAIEALTSLGYDKNSIMNALSDISTENIAVGEIVRLALKKLMR